MALGLLHCSSSDDGQGNDLQSSGGSSNATGGAPVTSTGGTVPTGSGGARPGSGGAGGMHGMGTGGSTSPPLPPSPRMLRVHASGMPGAGTSGRMQTNSVAAPTALEYAGMGTHCGESVVLGLKIKLANIVASQKPPGNQNNPTGTLFDWSAAPKEIAIENGVSGAIDDTGELRLPDGDYSVLQINYLSLYSLKAYAYLDTNADGDIDTTVYTTAAGVVSVAGESAPTALVDLDYTDYGFTYSFNADSATRATTLSTDFTLLTTPIVIGGATPGSEGDAGDGGAESGDLVLNLFIDSYRIVKVWDGIANSATDNIDVIFPQGAGEQRTNSFGVHLTDLYPFGHPTFGLQYIPMFAFLGGGPYTSETYLFAPSMPLSFGKTQAASFIFDAAGTPVIGRIQPNPSVSSLNLGQGARMFEPLESDAGIGGYRFYTEYGIKDANGVDDGGMYYHNDKSMAGHVIDGFHRLPVVQDVANIVVTDGPRCKAEYDYCLGERTGLFQRVR